MQIFVSYAQEDRTIYAELCAMLGQSYWDADAMPPGATLKDKLREGIKACDACLFVATKHSIASEWCLAELGAFWGADKPVIPFIADPTIDERQFPPYLQGLVWTSDPAKAVKQANEAATKQRGKFPAVAFETLSGDGDAVLRILHLLAENRGKFATARLIQYSGDYIYPILQTLASWNVQVQLLLMHPAQLLSNPNFPVIDLQLGKLKSFHRKPDLDLATALEIRYYLHPASLRGLAIPNVVCALGWYTHEGNWLYGHRNATVIAHGPDVARTALWDTFDKVFTAMWQGAIMRDEDKSNIDRLLSLDVAPPGKKLRVPGIVIRGYGVASGVGREEPGTLAQQAEALSRYIDWGSFFQGTINVSIAPMAFAWRNSAPTIGRLHWSAQQAPEDFCLAPCQLEANGAVCDAWVYYPHPRTKSQNFHSPSTVEVIAPRIEGIQYGSAVAVHLNTSLFAVW